MVHISAVRERARAANTTRTVLARNKNATEFRTFFSLWGLWSHWGSAATLLLLGVCDMQQRAVCAAVQATHTHTHTWSSRLLCMWSRSGGGGEKGGRSEEPELRRVEGICSRQTFTFPLFRHHHHQRTPTKTEGGEGKRGLFVTFFYGCSSCSSSPLVGWVSQKTNAVLPTPVT